MIKAKHISKLITTSMLVFAIGALSIIAGNQTASAAPGSTCYTQRASNSAAAPPLQVECDEDTGDPGNDCRISINGADFVTVDCDDIDVSQSGAQGDINFNFSLNGTAVLEEDIYCGKGDKQVKISFDIGCLGDSHQGSELNPVLDMLFALLRFVSAGVGLVVIGSIIYAGIQYSASRGNPQTTEAAIKRVANSIFALLIYIFSFALLNFLVPGGLFI